MKSLKFPDMLTSSSINIVEGFEASLQNLKLLLATGKNELFGDPYFGTNLKRYLYDQNDSLLRDIIIDDIYTAIATFLPQVLVNRNDIKISSRLGKLIVTIKAINRSDYQLQEFSIVLLDTDISV